MTAEDDKKAVYAAWRERLVTGSPATEQFTETVWNPQPPAAVSPGGARVREAWLTDVAGTRTPVSTHLTIGRLPDSTLQIDDPDVSRNHAEIRLAGSDHLIEDLESKNGTYVNGLRIQSQLLSDGDEIAIGGARLLFQVGL